MVCVVPSQTVRTLQPKSQQDSQLLLEEPGLCGAQFSVLWDLLSMPLPQNWRHFMSSCPGGALICGLDHRRESRGTAGFIGGENWENQTELPVGLP